MHWVWSHKQLYVKSTAVVRQVKKKKIILTLVKREEAIETGILKGYFFILKRNLKEFCVVRPKQNLQVLSKRVQ